MVKKYFSDFSMWEFIPILNSISDAIFIDDKDGYSLWCNKACEKLYKVSPDDIRGMHVSELEKNGIFTPSAALQVTLEKKEVTLIHENKEGKRLLTTASPIFNDEKEMTKIVTTSRDITELVSLQDKLESVRHTLNKIKTTKEFSSEGIIANSTSMYNVMQLVRRLASVDSTVLITGESGVGKGVIAKLLHKNGSRRDRPFISVNCGAIPENLIESELFGYKRGAFTGSRAEGKKGLFQAAQGGTIFLDEISELPMNLQVKLLQVIQEKMITPVGGLKSIPIDVRIISATNKELLSLVHSGTFREDLYYRLNVIPITVPPLRERLEDILPLLNYYLDYYNKALHDKKLLSPNATAILMKYTWPGNVRELQNIMERLIITTKEDTITEDKIPIFILDSARNSMTEKTVPMSLKEALSCKEKEILSQAYKQFGSTRAMAKALDISQPSVVRKMQKYNIKEIDT